MALATNSSSAAERFCVLGVDPALAGATGYGVIEFVGSTPRMLRFGAVTHPHSATTGARLHAIHEMIAGLVAEFTPDAVAVEDVFSKINVGTALKLAEVRGVVLLAAAQASIPAHSYSPREVKSSVAGYGDASKLQMQQMVRSALGIVRVSGTCGRSRRAGGGAVPRARRHGPRNAGLRERHRT